MGDVAVDTTYAHSRNAYGERQPLVRHLRAVAELAAEFSEPLGTEQLGYYAGLWHDLGKFDPAWQRYLLDAESGHRGRSVDHKAAGAKLAAQICPILSVLIHGHHGGLRAPNEVKAWLAELGESPGVLNATNAAESAFGQRLTAARLENTADLRGTQLEMFIRLLYSALVDADSLDTERHARPDSAEIRQPGVPLSELWQRLEAWFASRPAAPFSVVNRVREEIRTAAIVAAERPPGLFRLAAPTGGGKTLSGLAFALRHAAIHGLSRVVVAVPFITITEQTVDVYRSVLSVNSDIRPTVLEHHSGQLRDAASDQGIYVGTDDWSKLATENWDAPVVVTTTVQLFESLFSNSRSGCRKLHRLARAVIVLDEAQALPLKLIDPILDALRDLCARYGSTVVISTATQPAFDVLPAFAELPATNIVPDAPRHFDLMRRVDVEWRVSDRSSWSDVAGWLSAERSSLAIVNTRRQALDLLDALGDHSNTFHLSTLLCGAHRRQVLSEIRERLRSGQPCMLVATQVVEAGVDIDFPSVFRAIGPFDSIIQAAGRCNREGRATRGRLVVFEPEDDSTPRGQYSAATGWTRALHRESSLDGVVPDIDDPATVARYFRLVMPDEPSRGRDIQRTRQVLDFPRTDALFRMIDDASESVVVDYGDLAAKEVRSAAIAGLVDRRGSPRDHMRSLQPYVVSIKKHRADDLRRGGRIQPILDGLGLWLGGYGERGIQLDEQEVWVV
jgi:CRISPR-associated endonuclease/helicase Cas3